MFPFVCWLFICGFAGFGVGAFAHAVSPNSETLNIVLMLVLFIAEAGVAIGFYKELKHSNASLRGVITKLKGKRQ